MADRRAAPSPAPARGSARSTGRSRSRSTAAPIAASRATRSRRRSPPTASTSCRAASSTTARAAPVLRRPLPELPGRRRRPAQRARLRDAGPRRHDGPPAERLAVAALRPAGADRPVRPAPARRLLLQDVHPAAPPVAAVRARPSAGRRPRPGRPERAVRTSTPRRRHLHADVAVVGGGPAGCLAALEAAAAGARVVLVDDQPELGGHLRIRTRRGRRATRGSPACRAATRPRRLAELVAAEPRHRAPRRAPPRSASTRAAWSASARATRSSASGRGRSWSRPAPPSGRRCSTTTTGPGSCSRRRHPAAAPAARGRGRASACVVVTDDDHGWRPGGRAARGRLEVAALVDAPRGDGRRRPERDRPATPRGRRRVSVGATVLAATGRGARHRRCVITHGRPASGRSPCDLVAMAADPSR